MEVTAVVVVWGRSRGRGLGSGSGSVGCVVVVVASVAVEQTLNIQPLAVVSCAVARPRDMRECQQPRRRLFERSTLHVPRTLQWD